MNELMRQLQEAVIARRECKRAYDDWYDAFDPAKRRRMSRERLRKEHNLEAALRGNLGAAERRILDLAERIADEAALSERIRHCDRCGGCACEKMAEKDAEIERLQKAFDYEIQNSAELVRDFTSEIERLRVLARDAIHHAAHGDYRNGNVGANGCIDEGEASASRYLDELIQRGKELDVDPGLQRGLRDSSGKNKLKSKKVEKPY